MHVSQELPKGHVVFEIQDVAEGIAFCRVVIEHQKDASECQNDEQVEGDSTHSPGIWITNGVAIDLRGMQVEKDVGENCERTIARVRAIVRDTEDRLPQLCVLRILVSLRFINRT